MTKGGHYREFSAELVAKPNVDAAGPSPHDPFGSAKLCNDKWVLRKYGKPMLMTAGGYMVDPREYASRCAKPVASGSGSVPGSDSRTDGPDSDDGPGSFLPGSGSVFCSGTSGLREAMLVETPSTCRDDLIGAGGEEVEVEMEARPELSVGHRGGNEAGDEEVLFHPWHCPRPPVPDLGPCVSCGNPGVIGCAGCLEIFCGDCNGMCLDCRVGYCC